MPDGPTLPEPVRADGTYCRVIASSTGRAYLSLGRDHAEAEIVSVDIGWSQITLRGRLVNSPAEACSGDGGTDPQERQGEPDPPGDLAGGRLHLHRAHGRLRRLRFQGADLGRTAAPPRGRSLKLCRRRTDVRSPGDVFRMPNRLLTADDGTALRINPYYTPVGSLAFRAALIPSGS